MVSASKIGLLLTGVVLIMYLLGDRLPVGIQLLDVLEFRTYDMRMRSEGTRIPAGDVTIAAIDEKSLAAIGRWPWSRRTQAELIDKLDALGARVIALDIFFSESENSKLLAHIGRLEAEQGATDKSSPYESIKRALATDSTLARAITNSGKVILSIVLLSEEEASGRPAAEATRALDQVQDQAIRAILDSGDGSLNFDMPRTFGVLVNLPEIQSGAKYAGHINSTPDSDGTVRRASLVMRHKGHFFPSADVQAARAYLGVDDLLLHTTHYGITGLVVGSRTVKTDERGRALIHYHGPEKTIPTISISDIDAGTVDPAFIKDKIVIVGPTAKGIGDVVVTPYGTVFPGVEIRANTIQNLIDNDFINRPDWVTLVDALVILVVGLLLSWLLTQIGMWQGAALALAFLVIHTLVAVMLFRAPWLNMLWLNIVYPSVLIVLLFVSSTITKYVSAETGKRQIKKAFQHYVPTAVVNDITDNVDRLRLGGEKRELTVLFSDIRGFTSVSQSLAPEDLVRLLNVYLTQMTAKVFDHDGLLDKYIGDAIMAVYGAPIHREDHAVLACRTALDMLDALDELQVTWKAEGLPILDIGVGINTGSMVVGNMGSEDRFDYTVIGDAVNLGSRIEALNKTYGTRILISEFTYEQVRGEFPHVREIDITRVRGRTEPVRIYELMRAAEYSSMDWVAEYQQAYKLVRKNEPSQALLIFQYLDETVNDPVSKYYMQSCRAALG